MSQASKLKSSRVLTFLLVLFIVPGVMGQTPRFRGPKEFLPYTRNLPRIDKTEESSYPRYFAWPLLKATNPGENDSTA